MHAPTCTHTQRGWVSLAYESRITVKWLAVRLKLPNIPNGHTPVTRWREGLSSLSSIFNVIVMPSLQSAFLSCHFQQVPGTTFPLATPSQKSWSYSEDPGISGVCGEHAPRYKTTNGFVRSGLWLKNVPRKEDKGKSWRFDRRIAQQVFWKAPSPSEQWCTGEAICWMLERNKKYSSCMIKMSPLVWGRLCKLDPHGISNVTRWLI